MWVQVVWLVVQVVPALWRVHWVQVVQGARASGVLRCVFRPFIPAFCPLACFALGALLANMALFRILRAFLAGFPCWMWVCIVRVPCMACGAFVCVNS